MRDKKFTDGTWDFDRNGDVFSIWSADGEIADYVHQEANARLIAAAPELLEALQELLDLYNADEGCRELPQYCAACTAIAKALGEDQ